MTDGFRWALQILALFLAVGSQQPLYKWNDVELFDLQTDPDEMINLAANLNPDRNLISGMSAKLEAMIKAEIAKDDGRELPNTPFVHWTIERIR